MLGQDLWVPVSWTGPRSVWTVALGQSPLLTHHGPGLTQEGGGLPVQGRRDNLQIVPGACGVAAAGRVPGWSPVEGYSWFRSRMRIWRYLHRPALSSCPQVFPALWIVPGHQGFRLHFPPGFPEKIPCLLLHQHVRCWWGLVDQKSLLKYPTSGKIRHWYSPARLEYSCRSYPADPALPVSSSLQDLAGPSTAAIHCCHHQSRTRSPGNPGNFWQAIRK